MKMSQVSKPLMVLGAISAALLSTACSGPNENPRITLCKNLTTAVQSSANSIEWKGDKYTFNRPSYAITHLSYDMVGPDGTRTTGTSACHYAYEALEDTAQILANPIEAYATLPFAMSVDGRVMSDAQLLRTVNAEQARLGRKALSTLEKGARDMAEKIRAGVGG